MKNIHVLPTDKSSRLFLGNNGNFVFGMMQTSIQSRNDDFTNQNIYITSDEEIKVGDWKLDTFHNQTSKVTNINSVSKYDKKIILTTDQDLIKDGVQEIPEYFLIHYIVGNNPIEYVEIKEHLESIDTMKINYELIIPKEETKNICIQTGLPCGMQCLSEDTCNRTKSKQETLEQAAKKFWDKLSFDDAFEAGAKWQQEQNGLTPNDLIEFSKWVNKMGYSHRLTLIPNDLIDFYLKNRENIIKLNLE